MKHLLFAILCILIGMSCTDTTPTVTFKDESGIITVNVDTVLRSGVTHEPDYTIPAPKDRPLFPSEVITVAGPGITLSRGTGGTGTVTISSSDTARYGEPEATWTVPTNTFRPRTYEGNFPTFTVQSTGEPVGKIRVSDLNPQSVIYIYGPGERGGRIYSIETPYPNDSIVYMKFICQEQDAKVTAEVPSRYWAQIPRTFQAREEGFDDVLLTIQQMKDLVNLTADWKGIIWTFKLPEVLRNRQVSCEEWTPRQSKILILAMLEAEYGN